MIKRCRIIPILLGIAFAAIFTGPVLSAETEVIDVRVSINATKSLSVGATSYSFGAMDVNTSSVSTTALVVTNDSGGLIETFTIQGGNAISDSGGTDWTLAASTGTDQYVLSAQFSNSQPANSESAWSSDALSLTAQVCSDTQFGNGNSSESGANVSPASGINTRNLWLRIITPDAVTDGTGHTATVTLAVQ